MMAEQSWLQSLGLDNILRALIPLGSTAMAVWGAWKWGAERADKKQEEQVSRQERVQRELDAQQALMSKQGADALAWVRDEAERYRKRVLEVEGERDEAYHSADGAWDVARGWKERCHHLKHELENARSLINAAHIQLNLPARQWIDERLPPIEQIVEDNARRFSLRASIYRPSPPSEDESDP